MTKLKSAKGSFYTNMAILSAVLVSESLSATLMMPFVGLFVAHLQHIAPSEAGYMSGLLISVFQLGQVLTGKMWGTASDRVGRKPMIQMGLLANTIVSIFFGMSPTLTFCVVMRFIHGCANGNVLVAKTVIADITDKETEGMGFAAISIFWGVGSIVGPAIGGYLYDPVHHAVLGPRLFPGVTEESESLFFEHPALLPCLVISVFSVCTLFLISWILPETSRHPVDPILSLFNKPTSTHKSAAAPVAAQKGRRSKTSESKSGGQQVGALAVLQEGDYNEDYDDPDDNDDGSDADSADGDDRLAATGVTASWRSGGSVNARAQLTKRLFTSTSPTVDPSSLNNVITAARLVREYERRESSTGNANDGPLVMAANGLQASRVASRSSSNGRRPEPRRRKTEDAKTVASPSPSLVSTALSQPQRHGRDTGASPVVVAMNGNQADSDGDDAAMLPSSLEKQKHGELQEEVVVTHGAPMNFGYREVFRLPSSRNVMIVYMCIASTESALLEIIPLWAISEREKGGLGFASADIGTLLCISSVVYVAVNVVFSRVLKCLGGATRPLWDFSVMLWCVTSILTPCCAYLANDTTIFYAASLITSVREIGLSWSYSILYMYVVRCAPDDCAGSINGIAQSIGSLSRMLTMLFIPPIFAWSLNGVNNPFPFNFHFVFWVTCLPLLLSFAVSSVLPVRVTG